MKKEEGLRYNQGKIRHDLFEPHAIDAVAAVFTKGAEKYRPRNWEFGMSWSKVLASMKRHLNAFERGEDFDPETELHHMAHVAWNAMALESYYKIFPEGDDRNLWYKKSLKRVYLDIDGILADFETHFLSYLNLPTDHPTDWNDSRFRDNFHLILNDTEFWLTIPPIVNTIEISYPIEGYCTSRPISNEVTQEWLDMYGFPKGQLINVGMEGKKSEVLKDICDVFVDDSIKNFIDCHNNGILCYLMTRPHNEKYTDVGHLRVKNMNDFIQKLKY